MDHDQDGHQSATELGSLHPDQSHRRHLIMMTHPRSAGRERPLVHQLSGHAVFLARVTVKILQAIPTARRSNQ